MLRLTVENRNTDPVGTFTIEGEIHSLTLIKLAIKEQTGIEPEEQVLIHRDNWLLHMDDSVWSILNRSAFPVISLYKRLPNNQLLNVTVDNLRGAYRMREVRRFSLNADLPVRTLKRHVARKFLVAPCNQMLLTRSAPMSDSDLLGSYTPTPEMLIILEELPMWSRLPRTLHINVQMTVTGREETYTLEEWDTLDVLLGYMERAHILGPRDQPRIFHHHVELLDTSQSFQDYGIRDGALLTTWL